MWTLLAIAAAASIAFGLIAVGLAIWHDARPSTDKERARLALKERLDVPLLTCGLQSACYLLITLFLPSHPSCTRVANKPANQVIR